MTWKILALWTFGIMSAICFSTEFYEITTGIDVEWSDQLHNLLDHVMYVIVNYIGFKVARGEHD